MTKKSIVDIRTFAAHATAYLKRHEMDRDNQLTKLRYALKKVRTRAVQVLEVYEEAVEDLRVDKCLVDPETKAIERDQNAHYRFTREASREFARKAKEARDKLYDIEPHMISVNDVPSDVLDSEMDAFAGFVLPDADEAREPLPLVQSS